MYLALPLLLLSALPIAPAEVDTYLQQLQAGQPGFSERLRQVAVDSVGIPYKDGPLGEGPYGEYDKDPLIDLSRVDCVTFVEQSIALAASPGYAETMKLLQGIRYAGGEIGYESRNHFFITDWIHHNDFCKEITGDLKVPLGSVTRTISRKGFFERVKAPGLGLGTPDKTVRLEIVSPENAAAAEAQLPSPALIVFVGKVDWLFALHCGLYLRDKAGHGKLYHASSKAGAVSAVSLGAYVEENSKRYLGFSAYAIGDPRKP